MTTVSDLIYLITCVINGITPDAERMERISQNLEELYQLAAFHQVTALAAAALSRGGIRDKQFMNALAISAWRESVMGKELERVEEAFEKAGIWHMTLKGFVLKECYPGPGLRQMSDIDLLIDPAGEAASDEIMASLGFNRKDDPGHDFENHGMYVKEPVSCFEIHWKLMGKKTLYQEGYSYYDEIEDRLLTDESDPLVRYFSEEDFYLYMIAHEYKHYNFGGTGLRSLVDTYVYLKKKRKELDGSYIRREAGKMGISDFEKNNRQLAMKVFAPGGYDSLTKEEKEQLIYYISSGTYGVINHVAANKARNMGRRKFLWSRFFPPMSAVKKQYPVFYKYKILLPFLPFYRIFTHSGRVKYEIDALKKHNKKGTP